MRIVHVCSGLGLGGAERQIVLLTQAMLRAGHEVAIYLLNRVTDRVSELEGLPVELVVDQKRVRFDPAVVLRLRRFVRRWRPDVVHGWLYDGNLYARMGGAGSGAPVLNSERSHNYAVSRLQRWGYGLTRGWMDALVANSGAGAAFAAGLHGLAPDRTFVVWNGIELGEVDARLRLGAHPAQEIWPGEGLRRLCMVGAIKPAKDHELALRTFGELAAGDPAWRLICVGDELPREPSGPKAELMALCESLGLADRVRFVGHRRDVPELMASCDAVLVTSRWEGFPNVVLEAMAAGAPVASTEYSDVRRILTQPWQVAQGRDPRELARIVRRCVAERPQVCAVQRQWVEANATVQASARAMLDVYQALLAGRRGA